MKFKIITLSFLLLALLSACSSAGDIDGVLSKAKADGKVVMLELGSVGCASCEQMKPVMERLRSDYKGKLEVLFVDIRQDRAAAQRFRVVMMPTQVFLDRSGKEFHRHIGFYAYEEIAAVLKKTGL